MRLAIQGDVLELFPEVRIAVVVACGISNRRDGPGADEAGRELRAAQEKALAALGDVPIADHSRIRCWREAYRSFGAKPKDNPSSIESLLRRTLKGETIRPINPLVDLYNVVSLSHLLPAGGEDLDRLEGDVLLTRASADEAAVVLLGEREERAPRPGEVIYKDSIGAVCRRWNWKEAERTKLTEATRNAVLVLEAIPPISYGELEAAARDLADRARERCGGSVVERMVDATHPEIALG